MYPYIHFVLPSYGVLAFLGGFLALVFVYYRTGQFEIDFSDFLKLFALCIISGIVGSKILFVISRIPWLFQNLTLLNLANLILRSGYVFYGGLFGVLLAIILYSKHSKKYSMQKLLSLTAPAIPLFHCFGRIGCWLAGCCFGIELPKPIVLSGVSFKRFPTQLLEALFEVVLFIIMLTLERRPKDYPLLRTYLISYACFRFFIEFFRGDEIRGIFFGLSTSQWISAMILVLYFVKVQKHRFMKKYTDKQPTNPC